MTMTEAAYEMRRLTHRKWLVVLGRRFLAGLPPDIAIYLTERADPNANRDVATIMIGEWLERVDGPLLWDIIHEVERQEDERATTRA